MGQLVDQKTGEPPTEGTPEREEFNKLHEQAADLIGQHRTLLGEQEPGPVGPVKMALARLVDKTHILNHLKNTAQYGDPRTGLAARLEDKQFNKTADYQAQNGKMADQLATGAPTDKWNEFSANYKRVTGKEPPDDVKQEFARKQGGLAEVEKPEAQSWKPIDLQLKDGNKITAEYNAKDGSYRHLGSEASMTPEELDGATAVPKPVHPPSPKAGMSGGKNVFAVLTDKGWVDAGSKEPLKDFRPAPTFAETGLWGVDPVQNTNGTIGSAMVNRRTGQTKQITGAGGTPIAPSLMAQVNQSLEPAIAGDTRLTIMQQNEKDAAAGNQQAMLSLVANHIGMTLGAQKGARINQAVWNEAVESAPWLQNVVKSFGADGYLQGVKLSPQQAHQMVELAKQRRDAQWEQAQQAGTMYGVNIPIPDDVQSSPSGPVHQSLTKAAEVSGGQKFVEGTRHFHIPAGKVEAFKKAHPDARPE
jgi:hypothetical protein